MLRTRRQVQISKSESITNNDPQQKMHACMHTRRFRGIAAKGLLGCTALWSNAGHNRTTRCAGQQGACDNKSRKRSDAVEQRMEVKKTPPVEDLRTKAQKNG